MSSDSCNNQTFTVQSVVLTRHCTKFPSNLMSSQTGQLATLLSTEIERCRNDRLY
ncbi:UNVERIFIED_CONTAM: hypothetical protein FKN15_042030 [Acipenser sinensis]